MIAGIQMRHPMKGKKGKQPMIKFPTDSFFLQALDPLTYIRISGVIIPKSDRIRKFRPPSDRILMHGRYFQELLKYLILCLLWPGFAPAQAANLPASPALYGPLGLNTIPNARMDKPGMLRAGISSLDPYVHGWLGIQIADPLYIGLRQTAETSAINKNPDRLYPGIDLKWRILEETRARPEIAIGMQSAIGHKRMAGEYIAASKRYRNFDFTAGLGWGRLGSAGHFKNPFSGLFNRTRALDGEAPAKPGDWFTGKSVGLFGGIEYFTAIDGLSAKLDYNADRYIAERDAFGFKPSSPWSAGLNYSPIPGLDLGLAAQGTDKIMGRLSLSGLIQNWRRRDYDRNKTQFTPLLRKKAGKAQARLSLEDGLSAPYQISVAAKNISARKKSDAKEISITPGILSLKGPTVKLIRSDLQSSSEKKYPSAEEIWHNTSFETKEDSKIPRPDEPSWPLGAFRFRLENQLSLSEEDKGTLYRTSFIAGGRTADFFGLIDNFYSLRLNLADNLKHLSKTRSQTTLPVRSNEDIFAQQKISINTMFSAFTHSFRPDLHLSLLGGYLEEMYGGFGGEILYRPFDSRLSVGAESWLAFKRDPLTDLNLGFNGDSLLTGHVNLWYDLPLWDVTAHLSAGRYLAEDIGGTIGLQKQFENGARLEGFVTLTNHSDTDPYGNAAQAYNGLRLSVPLGGYKYIPRNTDITLVAAPFGRNFGQRLENPLPLHEITQPFTLQHMAQHWDDMTTK